MKEPYIQLLDQRGDFNIWIVNGEWIRSNIDVQFTNADQPLHAKYIPANELWIDREAAGDETQFLIDGLLIEYKLMKRGMLYKEALNQSDEIVERERRKKDGLKGDVTGTLEANKSVYLEKLGETEDGIEIWLVHGELVRAGYDVDFTEGGHGLVYKYIPDNEVWIDDDIFEEEHPFIILHELHEYHKMENGWNYEQSHADASRVEWFVRHHLDELKSYLEVEGWILSDAEK